MLRQGSATARRAVPKKACPENVPIPHPKHNSRNRAVLVGLWGMGAILGAPKL